MNYKLYFSILTSMIVPVLYRTIRFYGLGNLPDPYSFSIAGNLEGINVLFEVLNEAFVLPVYFVFAMNYRRGDGTKVDRPQTGVAGKLYVILAIYTIFTIVFIGAAKELMLALSSSDPNPENIAYIRLQLGNQFFAIVSAVSVALLTLHNKGKLMLLILTIQTVCGVFLDTFLVSNLKVSAKLGVMGVGWGDLINYSITGLLAFFAMVKTLGITTNDFLHPIFSYYVGFAQALISGFESLVRNAFFLVFVIATVNRLGNGFSQGDYGLTNTVIWDGMLMPVLAAAIYTNRTVASSDKKKLGNVVGGPAFIVLVTIILGFVFIPVYEPFAKYVLNTPSFRLIAHLQLISLGFYILFACNEVIDKIFYGKGKPIFILVQSLFTNLVVYLPYYFTNSILTIDDVAVMFGTSVAVDSALTIVMFAAGKLGGLKKLQRYIAKLPYISVATRWYLGSRFGKFMGRFKFLEK